MHFYYFYLFLYQNQQISRIFPCLLCHQLFFLSPIQGLEPGATPCRGGRCAAPILADCSSRNKTILRL